MTMKSYRASLRLALSAIALGTVLTALPAAAQTAQPSWIMPEILAAGTAPLARYRQAWSAMSLAKEYETILDRILAGRYGAH